MSHLEIDVPLRQDCTRYTSRFFRNSRDRVWMHGHGFPPGFIRSLVFVQYLIFLSDPALAIRQQYLSEALPVHRSLEMFPPIYTFLLSQHLLLVLWCGEVLQSEEVP